MLPPATSYSLAYLCGRLSRTWDAPMMAVDRMSQQGQSHLQLSFPIPQVTEVRSICDSATVVPADIIGTRQTCAHSTTHILVRLRLLPSLQTLSTLTRRGRTLRLSVVTTAGMKHITKATRTKTGLGITQTA